MFNQVQDKRFNGGPHLSKGVATGAGHGFVQRAGDLFADDLQRTGKNVVLVTKVKVKSARGTPRFPHDARNSRGMVAMLAEQTNGRLQKLCAMRFLTFCHLGRCAIDHGVPPSVLRNSWGSPAGTPTRVLREYWKGPWGS